MNAHFSLSSSALCLYPVCHFTSTHLHPHLSLCPLLMHPRALRLHSGCFYVKMMIQKMFSWHRANSTLAKLDIQSNSQVTSTRQNQKNYMIPREPFHSHVFIPVYHLPQVLLSLSKLEIAIYTMSAFKSSQSSSQLLKPFVNYEIRLVLALIAT